MRRPLPLKWIEIEDRFEADGAIFVRAILECYAKPFEIGFRTNQVRSRLFDLRLIKQGFNRASTCPYDDESKENEQCCSHPCL